MTSEDDTCILLLTLLAANRGIQAVCCSLHVLAVSLFVINTPIMLFFYFALSVFEDL